MNIEQTLAESETLRKELIKKVAHFENSARRALSFASKLNFGQILLICFDDFADLKSLFIYNIFPQIS